MGTSKNVHDVLERLRSKDPGEEIESAGNAALGQAVSDFRESGVRFASSGKRFEDAYYTAVKKLAECITSFRGDTPVLLEGGVYRGTWLESTGTINAEILSRFMPSVSQATFSLFASHMKEDGQMPYKITAAGASYRQIQMVTPLARSVWNHYLLTGKREREFLESMYGAMERFDGWLERYRNTRGTGCVEAFCAFDTGHDLSSRFWHVPDTTHLEDARRYDPDSPILPFLAPDLTANVACQRYYLSRIAAELGKEPGPWEMKADESTRSLFAHCWDKGDEFFYDRDREGRFVKIQSDNLLRVLACETGDGRLFESSLRRYLLNTRKFFAKYPFTSISMDDPRFDPHNEYNTWAGTTNFLSLIRTPHAFEHHGRHVELTWVLQPIVSALSRMTRFSQCLSPWTGEEGFTESYSPAILCMLDFVERLSGILPRPDGELWFTGLVPYPLHSGTEAGEITAYGRIVNGTVFELTNTRTRCVAYRNGKELCDFPSGTRIITDGEGNLRAIVGMSVRTVTDVIRYGGKETTFTVQGNERLEFRDDRFSSVFSPGIVPPQYE